MGMSLRTQTGLAPSAVELLERCLLQPVRSQCLGTPWSWQVAGLLHQARCTHHPILQAADTHLGPCVSAFLSPGVALDTDLIC